MNASTLSLSSLELDPNNLPLFGESGTAALYTVSQHLHWAFLRCPGKPVAPVSSAVSPGFIQVDCLGRDSSSGDYSTVAGGFGLQWWPEALVLPEVSQVAPFLAGGPPQKGCSLLGISLKNHERPHSPKNSDRLPEPLAHSGDGLVFWEAKQMRKGPTTKLVLPPWSSLAGPPWLVLPGISPCSTIPRHATLFLAQMLRSSNPRPSSRSRAGAGICFPPGCSKWL